MDWSNSNGLVDFTLSFPDGMSKDVIRPLEELYKKFANKLGNGQTKQIKSLLIFQASITIPPYLLTEIVCLVNHCMQKENRCIFQFGSLVIWYHNAGKVHVHNLKEGDVPKNVEARWKDHTKTGITMRGLYLTGSQVNVGTKQTNKILRSVGSTTQGAWYLDELHLSTGEFHIPGEDSLIYASKVVVVDGVSLIMRSKASCILPPRKMNALIEPLCSQLQRISSFAKETINLFLQTKDHQPEIRINLLELRFDDEHLEFNVEHWNGVLEIELLDYRKEVLHYLQDLQASRVVECVGSPSLDSCLSFIRDKRYLEYWQEGLQVLNEVIHRNSNDSHFLTHISIRGGIQFLLGKFENALQDLDLAYLKMGRPGSTILLDRALVKCMLGRYSEAMQDVVAVITLNPNVNDIQELQACIQQILHQQRAIQIVT